jgi:subtilisin family serine protease
MGKQFRWFALVVLVLISAGAAYAGVLDQGTERSLLRLQIATFDPVVDGEPPAATANLSAGNDGPYYIVQFIGPIEDMWMEQIVELGAEPLGYIPDNASVVRLAPEDLPKVREMYAVRWVGLYRSAYKIAPALATGSHSAGSLAAAESQELVLQTFPGESPANLEHWLQQQGVTINEISDTPIGVIARVLVPATFVEKLSLNPAISWIESYVEPQINNVEARRVMGVESVWQSAGLPETGLYGSGQIVAVSDSGLSVQGNLNNDFAGRLIRAYSPAEMAPHSSACRSKADWTDLNGHGTHVAGSILGNGRNSGSDPTAHQYSDSYAGIAPEARLVFMALNHDGDRGFHCVPSNGNYIAFGYENGARISSNSWGAETNGIYTYLESVIDDYLWRHPDYLVLFAAGNHGPSAHTISSGATAKNVLTVGASENYRPDFGGLSDNPDSLAQFSSRGPTEDGRVKPDLVAPGTFILSTRAEYASDHSFWESFNAYYAYMGGTSMATPLTAGSAALVREWLTALRGISEPSAALMKALLINGTVPLTNAATPNMESGWGRVDLKNTLDGHYAVFDDNVQGLRTSQVQTYTITVVGSTTQATLITGANLSNPAAIDTLRLTALPGSAQTATLQQSASPDFTITPVTGYDEPPVTASIPDADETPRDDQLPMPGNVPNIDTAAASPLPIVGSAGSALQNYPQSMVGGGDFEDPVWTDGWSQIWLGTGFPVRSSSGYGIVLRGEHSLWLGGTESDDMLSFPLSFPDEIDNVYSSYISFLLDMRNQDPTYDYFCLAITDDSGNIVGEGQDTMLYCGDEMPSGTQQIHITVNSGQRQALAGQTGYLNVLTIGDQVLPHMSAFVDDILLVIDFPSVTLESVPGSGPAGTTFLLAGSNNVPYGPVDVCVNACNSNADVLGSVYADARGDIKAYLSTTPEIPAGSYRIATNNIAGRAAQTSFSILDAQQPTLQVIPPSGAAGTAFVFGGAGFVPNDQAITILVNGTELDTTGSDVNGQIRFQLQSSSNTPPGTYTVRVSDSTGRSAAVSFEVTGIAVDESQMTVSPVAGLPGAVFTFTGSGFTANAPIGFALDGQSLGSLDANAAGGFNVQLTANAQIPPGSYILSAEQGQRRATATFRITATDGGGHEDTLSGNGIYATLVWTDPPGQAAATQTLVNNLDLRIEGPDGVNYGNGGSGPDILNNVESIRLERPVPGTYTVIVEAQRVSSIHGSQPYALVVTTAQNYNASIRGTQIDEFEEEEPTPVPSPRYRVGLPLLFN